MKYKCLLLMISVIAINLIACTKGGNKYPIVGKWKETKLRMYGQDGTGAFLYDTTFFHPFTNADFIQFNNNNTCLIGADYYYYANLAGQPKIAPQKIDPNTSTMNVTAVGSDFVLTTQSTLTNPGGFDVRDTVSVINSNTLLFHSVAYSHVPGYKDIVDAYYTR
ncbi:MAG: hypothetical protein ACXVB0_08115 [Mucilaginibacter sp.]